MKTQTPTFDFALAGRCAAACQRAYQEQTLGSDRAHVLVEDGNPRVIAFRGTACREDWITDFDVRWWDPGFRRVTDMPWADLGVGRVHHGFWEAAGSVIDQVLTLDGGETPVVITGHSLGAALAVLTAWRMARLGLPLAAVITFGGPRVGDSAWSRNYQSQMVNSQLETLREITWRIVNEEDIVARVPGWLMGYRHVGRELFCPAIGRARVDPPLWFRCLSDCIGMYRDYRFGRLAPVLNHPVVEYIDRLGNEIRKQAIDRAIQNGSYA